jgi:hypothetical protein
MSSAQKYHHSIPAPLACPIGAILSFRAQPVPAEPALRDTRPALVREEARAGSGRRSGQMNYCSVPLRKAPPRLLKHGRKRQAHIGGSVLKILGVASAFALFLVTTPALAAQTGLGPNCQKAYDTYEASQGPKAFARGKGKGCGYAARKASLGEARRSAIQFCRAYGGEGCRVVEESSM